MGRGGWLFLAFLSCVWCVPLACTERRPRRAEPSPSVLLRAAQASPALSHDARADAGVAIPAGYEPATVYAVFATEDDAGVVLLLDESGATVLPIVIGGAEAKAIDMRLRGQTLSRPLTLDLLSSLVTELGGAPVKVHIDDVHDQVFVGTVFVEQRSRTIQVDARPSDAIALALGSHVPILASKSLMLSSGFPRDVLDSGEGERVIEGKKRAPISL